MPGLTQIGFLCDQRVSFSVHSFFNKGFVIPAQIILIFNKRKGKRKVTYVNSLVHHSEGEIKRCAFLMKVLNFRQVSLTKLLNLLSICCLFVVIAQIV